MIRTSRDDIPRSTEGSPPDRNPRFVTALAEAFQAEYLEAGNDERATANGSVLRGSDAGSCGRLLSYEIRRRSGEPDMERTNPMTIADYWRLGLGSIIHERMEAPIKRAFPDAEVEVVAAYEDPDLSLHADVLIVHEGVRTLMEIKSIGGWGFKSCIGSGSRPAEGPRLSAILQGALAAKALDCDELVVGYLALELLSPAETKKRGLDEVGRFSAEWAWTADEFVPMADAELARLAEIQRSTTEGLPVKRMIPGLPLGAEIQDPATGRWELRTPDGTAILDSGSHFLCNYCGFQARCTADAKAGL